MAVRQRLCPNAAGAAAALAAALALGLLHSSAAFPAAPKVPATANATAARARAAAVDAEFCQGIIQHLFSCPHVAAAEDIDMEALTGEWHHIGASAHYAFSSFGQKGAQCVTAEYTLVDGGGNSQAGSSRPSNATGSSANTLSVLTHGLLVTSALRHAQTLGISRSSYAIAQGIKFMCQVMAGNQSLNPLQQLLKPVTKSLGVHQGQWKLDFDHRVNGSQRRLEEETTGESGTPHLAHHRRTVLPEAANLPNQDPSQPLVDQINEAEAVEGSQILRTVQSVRQTAVWGSVSSIVDVIQLIIEIFKKIQQFVDVVSSGILDAPISVAGFTTFILDIVETSPGLSAQDQNTIRREGGKVLDLVSTASLNAESIYGALEDLQKDTMVLSGSTLPKPYSATAVASSIRGLANEIEGWRRQLSQNRRDILRRAQNIQRIANNKDDVVYYAAGALVLMTQIMGPVDVSLAGITGGAIVISTTASLVTDEGPQQRDVSSNATAVQSDTDPGTFKVSLEGSGPGVGIGVPYKVVRVEGNTSSEYDTALVYTCSRDPFNFFLPQQSTFLLARSPQLSSQQVAEAVEVATSNGVTLSGDNVFVHLSQSQSICNPPK